MNRPVHQVSPELKQRLVDDIEAGHLSLREAASDARVSVTMVRRWLEEFGRFKPKRDVVEVVMRSEQATIAALEKALADAHLKLRVYEELITQANQRYKTDIKKNFGTTPPTPFATRQTRPASAPSAEPSGAPAMPTTNGRAAATRPSARKP